MTHVQAEHPENLEAFLRNRLATSSTSENQTDSLYYRRNTVHIQGLIEYVIMRLRQFSDTGSKFIGLCPGSIRYPLKRY